MRRALIYTGTHRWEKLCEKGSVGPLTSWPSCDSLVVFLIMLAWSYVPAWSIMSHRRARELRSCGLGL